MGVRRETHSRHRLRINQTLSTIPASNNTAATSRRHRRPALPRALSLSLSLSAQQIHADAIGRSRRPKVAAHAARHVHGRPEASPATALYLRRPSMRVPGCGFAPAAASGNSYLARLPPDLLPRALLLCAEPRTQVNSCTSRKPLAVCKIGRPQQSTVAASHEHARACELYQWGCSATAVSS